MATAADTLLLAESSDTITGGSSDHSIRTLTPQAAQFTEPVLSLLLDPIVSYDDLLRDAKMKLNRQRAASSDDILSPKQIRRQGLRQSSSLEALNQEIIATPLRQSVTQQALQLWNCILVYLKTNINCSRRQHRFKYYSNCFFGSEVIACLKGYLGRDVAESSLRVLSDKLVHAGVIVSVNEGGGERILSFNPSALYQFKSTEKSNDQKTATAQVSIHVKQNLITRNCTFFFFL